MAEQNCNAVAIGIEAMLAEAKPLLTTECCIYRVPHEIHKLNPDAYTPKVVSIGPFHYGNKSLQYMESHKQFYCRKFIERAKCEITFDNLVSCVQDLEPSVRHYYSHNITLSVAEFVKVILVDCSFIFEFFLRKHFQGRTVDEPIPLKPWLVDSIKLDLTLLENQLPFSVLENLYNRAFACRQNDGCYPSFLNLIFEYFHDYNELNLSPSNTTTSKGHFLDLLRDFHLPRPNARPIRAEAPIRPMYSASELNEAGVIFKVKKPRRSLLELRILSGLRGLYFNIPEFKLEDRTEILFRNMVALEQCHYPNEPYITDYVAILTFLIKTGKDVELLVHKKIIVNWSGDSNDAVAKMFSGLNKNITSRNFNSAYAEICRQLDDFCVHRWYRRIATLRRDYCKTPWQKAASLAAILVLILTITQTVFSILQVV